jgi:hypothetical protein
MFYWHVEILQKPPKLKQSTQFMHVFEDRLVLQLYKNENFNAGDGQNL